jgi:hypothetical protein
MRKFYKSVLYSILILLSVSVVAEVNEGYPVINSNTILSSEYLSSTYHRIESIDIENEFYHFSVESDIGHYDIHSLALLKKRVNEIKTIARAITIYEQQNDEFSGELRSQLSITSDSAVDLLTKPVSTASNLAGQLADNLNATLSGEDAFVYQSSKQVAYEPKDPTTATHKRNIAYQLGLDVYTNNRRVQSFLNTVANARSSGRVSAGVGLNNNLAKVDVADLKIRTLIKNKTLSELNYHNSELLSSIGVKKPLIKSFIEHPVLSPTNKTIITAYLSKLENVSRRDKFLELVLTADDELKASIFERLSKKLWWYHNNVEPVSAFSNYKGHAAIITVSRKIAFFDTADLFIWSEEKQELYEKAAQHAKQSGYKAWEIISFGELTPLANEKILNLAFSQQIIPAE